MALLNDPIDWLLDDNGDVVLTRDVEFSRGLPAVRQSIAVAIRMIRGEWFYDALDGVPYWERPVVPASDALLGQPYNELKALAAFRDAIGNTPHVLEILTLSVSLDRATRTLVVSWSVRTTFGDTSDETRSS